MPSSKSGPLPGPKNEPEVDAVAARRRDARTRPDVKADRTVGMDKAISIAKSIAIVTVVLFGCGLGLGACVAGIYLPIRGVQWLFGM